mmetsp:Transcript_319/g.724  ORF Transcript_319/g.724 Transcript_319/m.724 type:complete len:114 (-) Transcript_319:137-478(-)|eukprot:CAMPEP_0119564294 /NCGR_PEP_ID=MMETSP1352-20130426/26515_1 /TAXON_ID=265584 /ORGANISM="Stauroneis constricta, Strain CCMP1120" /LENGTH=113 /DNA_ID=CAMNT_0007613037 /DNA_START=205 /DNA_END=546 /DNA_ORIENTATION=+
MVLQQCLIHPALATVIISNGNPRRMKLRLTVDTVPWVVGSNTAYKTKARVPFDMTAERSPWRDALHALRQWMCSVGPFQASYWFGRMNDTLSDALQTPGWATTTWKISPTWDG